MASQPRLFGIDEIGTDTRAVPRRPRRRNSPAPEQTGDPAARPWDGDLTDEQAKVIEALADAMARGALAQARREFRTKGTEP